MPKMNLRNNFPLFLALIVVTLAIPMTVFVALNQTQLKSRADTPPSFPLTEFGTIINFSKPQELFCGGIAGIMCPNSFDCWLNGDFPDASGYCVQEYIENKRRDEPYFCSLDGTGKPVCPLLAPPSPDFCPEGQILSGGVNHCGCQMPPQCITPQPVDFALQTEDGRIYKLMQPYNPPCSNNLDWGMPCPRSTTAAGPIKLIDFNQYLGQTVLIEGYSDQSYGWPMPDSLSVFVENIQTAQRNYLEGINIEQPYYQNEISGYLINPVNKYVNDFDSYVYVLEKTDIVGELYIRSSLVDLYPYLHKTVALVGDLYIVGDTNDMFLNVTRVNDWLTPPVAPVPLTDLYFLNYNLELNQNSVFETKVLASTYDNQPAAFEVHLKFNPKVLSLDFLHIDSSLTDITLLKNPVINNTEGTASIIIGANSNRLSISGQGILLLTIKGKTKNVSGQYQLDFGQQTQVSQSGFNILRSAYPMYININESYLGDLNKDGVVNIFDFALAVQNFGRTQNNCSQGWNIADVIFSCKVDIFDFSIVIQDFGKGMNFLY